MLKTNAMTFSAKDGWGGHIAVEWNNEERGERVLEVGDPTPGMGSITVYARQAGSEEGPFLALADLAAERFWLVQLKTIGDVFALLQQLAPIITANAVTARLEHLTTMVDRLFRAEHGHGADVVCEGCDPLETKRRRDEKARLQRGR